MSTYLLTLTAALALVVAIRAALNWRDARRLRRLRLHKAQHGIRDFCGHDWTLPSWERHTTWNERRRSRQTSGSAIAELLFAVFGTLALYVITWVVFSMNPTH